MSENQGEGAGNASYGGGYNSAESSHAGGTFTNASLSGLNGGGNNNFTPISVIAQQQAAAAAAQSAIDAANQSAAETVRLAKQNAGEMGLGTISPEKLPVKDTSGLTLKNFLSGVQTAAVSLLNFATLANPIGGPIATAAKLGAAGSLTDTFSGFFSGDNSNVGSMGNDGGFTATRGGNGGGGGFSSGAGNNGFTLSQGYTPAVVSGTANTGGFSLSGSGTAPKPQAINYIPAFDAAVSAPQSANTANTATGGSMQAVAASQSKTDSTGLLATLAALASIFAVLRT
jgi:hypothetical protein